MESECEKSWQEWLQILKTEAGSIDLNRLLVRLNEEMAQIQERCGISKEDWAKWKNIVNGKEQPSNEGLLYLVETLARVQDLRDKRTPEVIINNHITSIYTPFRWVFGRAPLPDEVTSIPDTDQGRRGRDLLRELLSDDSRDRTSAFWEIYDGCCDTIDGAVFDTAKDYVMPLTELLRVEAIPIQSREMIVNLLASFVIGVAITDAEDEEEELKLVIDGWEFQKELRGSISQGIPQFIELLDHDELQVQLDATLLIGLTADTDRQVEGIEALAALWMNDKNFELGGVLLTCMTRLAKSIGGKCQSDIVHILRDVFQQLTKVEADLPEDQQLSDDSTVLRRAAARGIVFLLPGNASEDVLSISREGLHDDIEPRRPKRTPDLWPVEVDGQWAWINTYSRDILPSPFNPS